MTFGRIFGAVFLAILAAALVILIAKSIHDRVVEQMKFRKELEEMNEVDHYHHH